MEQGVPPSASLLEGALVASLHPRAVSGAERVAAERCMGTSPTDGPPHAQLTDRKTPNHPHRLSVGRPYCLRRRRRGVCKGRLVTVVSTLLCCRVERQRTATGH